MEVFLFSWYIVLVNLEHLEFVFVLISHPSGALYTHKHRLAHTDTHTRAYTTLVWYVYVFIQMYMEILAYIFKLHFFHIYKKQFSQFDGFTHLKKQLQEQQQNNWCLTAMITKENFITRRQEKLFNINEKQNIQKYFCINNDTNN